MRTTPHKPAIVPAMMNSQRKRLEGPAYSTAGISMIFSHLHYGFLGSASLSWISVKGVVSTTIETLINARSTFKHLYEKIA